MMRSHTPAIKAPGRAQSVPHKPLRGQGVSRDQITQRAGLRRLPHFVRGLRPVSAISIGRQAGRGAIPHTTGPAIRRVYLFAFDGACL